MNKQTKVWGDTCKLFSKNNVEIHRLNTEKGGYCSIHLHEFKYNQFYVERGEIEVTILRDNGINEVTVLKDNESTTVPPQLKHQFKSNKDSVVYEIYWVSMEGEDIVRDTVGGKI